MATMGRRTAACLIVACLAVAACGPGASADTPRPDVGASPGDVSHLDGVSVTVRVDPNPVRRGDPVSLVAVMRNDRPTPVDYSPGGCAFADLAVSIPVPWEPTGRTWAGREGWFKTYLLANAYAPGAVAAFSPITATLLSTPCGGVSGEMLEPGGELTADFTRAIGNFLRTYSYVETLPYTITVGIDRQNDPPPIEPGFTGIPPHFFPIYRQITATGELTIDGPPTHPLTAGQAIDRLLSDGRFAGWLRAQAPDSCETANLFLDNDRPPEQGTVWHIELFCETGVPRHFAFASIDAFSGELRRLDICDDPCDR